MFVGCSEIGIRVIIKHVQHIRSFSVPRGIEKITGLWFVRKDHYPG